MAKKFTNGILIPKGFSVVDTEPIDDRFIVEEFNDLLTLNNGYQGLRVTTLDQLNSGGTYKEFQLIGSDASVPSNWVETAWGQGDATQPTDLPLKFTSFIFRRFVGQPPTPVGGDYDTPIADDWSDGIPAGTDPIWTSSAVFTQGIATPAVWTEPILAEDTATTDFEYCNSSDPLIEVDVEGVPLPPVESPVQRTYWHDDPVVGDNYMAMGNKVAGLYPADWKVVKIAGEDGNDGGTGPEGRAYQPSSVFCRSTSNLTTAVVKGGSFSSPYPTSTVTSTGTPIAVVWTDGIPSGDNKVWMCQYTFNDIDNETANPNLVWSTPGGITDTATIDFEFSDVLANPGNPTDQPSNWESIATPDSIWMAQRTITNGIFGAWQIIKVKGEQGAKGEGLTVAGKDTIANILLKTSPPVNYLDIWVASDDDAGAAVPGVVNDAYLYLGAGQGEGGTAWANIGSVTGSDGVSYLYEIVYKRSVGVPATPVGGTFDSPEPPGWSDGVPAISNPFNPLEALYMSSRHFANNTAVNDELADWIAPKIATDTIDTDFEYALQQSGDTEPLPPDQAPPGVWTDLGSTNSYWMAQAKKINGITDDSTWTVLRIKGEKGATGESGIPSFLSSAYVKTNTDISGEDVTGGTYGLPVPTSTVAGNLTWSDGIPSGTGAIWFSQVQFNQDDTGLKVWPSPTKIADSSIVEYQFSSSTSTTPPSQNPVEGASGTNGWFDTAAEITGAGGTVRWMAVGSIQNGIWPTTWDKMQVTGEAGIPGQDARSYAPSSMFARCDDQSMGQEAITAQYLVSDGAGGYTIEGDTPSVDIGGTTYTFYDGIPPIGTTFPTNAQTVWMISTVFNSVDNLGPGNEAHWTTPTILSDNSSTDYEYHDALISGAQPGPPGTGGTNWQSSPDADTYWIAQKNWSEGVSAQWQVYQIRGEDGKDAVAVDRVSNSFRLQTGNVDFKDRDVSIPADTTATSSTYVTYYHDGDTAYPDIGDHVTTNDTTDPSVQPIPYNGNWDYQRVYGSNGADGYYLMKISSAGAVMDAGYADSIVPPVNDKFEIEWDEGTWETYKEYNVNHPFKDTATYAKVMIIARASGISWGGRWYPGGCKIDAPNQYKGADDNLRGVQCTINNGYVNIITNRITIFESGVEDGRNGASINSSQWKLRVTLYK